MWVAWYWRIMVDVAHGSFKFSRTQWVTDAERLSNSVALKQVVPQRSALGRILFLIYINKRSVCVIKSIQFADDKTLIKTRVKNKNKNRQHFEQETFLYLNATHQNFLNIIYQLFLIKLNLGISVLIWYQVSCWATKNSK